MKEIEKQSKINFLSIFEKISKCSTIFFVVLGFISLLVMFFEIKETFFFPKLVESFVNSSEILILIFIAGGFWIAIHQLQFTNSNAKRKQIGETLATAKIYFDEIKPLIEDVINVLDKKSPTRPLDWALKKFTIDEVEKKNPFWYEIFSNLERDEFLKVVNNLTRIENFAQVIKNGDIDKKLIYNLLATEFAARVGMIMGLIAYYRRYDNYPFCNITIELYKEWRVSVDELISRIGKPKYGVNSD